THPLTFQRKSVRSSIQCYLNFNLVKGKSPGFGPTTKYSTPYSDSLSLRLHIHCLTLHQIVTRRFILQNARHHPLTDSYYLYAHSIKFYYTPLPGYLSTLPHGTSPLSITREYLPLGYEPPRFRRNFPCSVVIMSHSNENRFSTK